MSSENVTKVEFVVNDRLKPINPLRHQLRNPRLEIQGDSITLIDHRERVRDTYPRSELGQAQEDGQALANRQIRNHGITALAVMVIVLAATVGYFVL